jgi:hypothetical protein
MVVAMAIMSPYVRVSYFSKKKLARTIPIKAKIVVMKETETP